MSFRTQSKQLTGQTALPKKKTLTKIATPVISSRMDEIRRPVVTEAGTDVHPHRLLRFRRLIGRLELKGRILVEGKRGGGSEGILQARLGTKGQVSLILDQDRRRKLKNSQHTIRRRKIIHVNTGSRKCWFEY